MGKEQRGAGREQSTGKPKYRIKETEAVISPTKGSEKSRTPRTPASRRDENEKEAEAMRITKERAREEKDRGIEREIEDLRSGTGRTYSRPPTQADIEVDDHNRSLTDETWIGEEFVNDSHLNMEI